MQVTWFILAMLFGVIAAQLAGNSILTKIKHFAKASLPVMDTEKSTVAAMDGDDLDLLQLTPQEKSLKNAVTTLLRIITFLVVLVCIFLVHTILYDYALFNATSLNLIDANVANFIFEKAAIMFILVVILYYMNPFGFVKQALENHNNAVVRKISKFIPGTVPSSFEEIVTSAEDNEEPVQNAIME